MKRKLHIAPLALLALATVVLHGGAALGQEEGPPAAEAAPVVDPAPEAKPEPTPAPTPAPEAAPGKEVSPDQDGADGGVAIGKSKALKVGGRVHAGYELVHESWLEPITMPTNPAEFEAREAELEAQPQKYEKVDDGWFKKREETNNEFTVKRARLKVSWRPDDWFLAVLQVDVAEAFELGGSMLRDAYVHFSPLDQLQIRIGQFKKPFSGLELQSPAKLKTVERGPGIEHIAEDLLYGERDLGLQLSGRLVNSVKLDYSIGVFNGSGPYIKEMDNSKDLVARVQIRPIKQLELGLNGSAKFYSDPLPLKASRAFAGGGDVRVQIKGFRFYAEGLAAGDHQAFDDWSTADPEDKNNFSFVSFAVIGMASYRFKFKTEPRFAIEPVFKVELFDPDSKIGEDHLWVLTPGINAYIGDYFHLMLDGEFVRSNKHSPEKYSDAEAIQVLACFDI